MRYAILSRPKSADVWTSSLVAPASVTTGTALKRHLTTLRRDNPGRIYASAGAVVSTPSPR